MILLSLQFFNILRIYFQSLESTVKKKDDLHARVYQLELDAKAQDKLLEKLVEQSHHRY